MAGTLETETYPDSTVSLSIWVVHPLQTPPRSSGPTPCLFPEPLTSWLLATLFAIVGHPQSRLTIILTYPNFQRSHGTAFDVIPLTTILPAWDLESIARIFVPPR